MKTITAPEILAMKSQKRIAMLTAYDYPTATMLDEAGVEDISERLALSRKYTEALRISKTHLPGIFQCMDGEEILPSKIYGMLKELPLEVLLFAMARCPGARGSINTYLTKLCKIKPLVNGSDLGKLGYPTGPLYSQILDRTFAAQLDGQIGDKEQAIQFVKKRFSL